jgi:phosphatidate cytidylyltransferase
VIAPDRSSPGPDGHAQAGPSDRQNFLRRTASALVLAPLAIGLAFFGGWVFAAACTVTAGLALWEWSRLVAAADGECATCAIVLGLPACPWAAAGILYAAIVAICPILLRHDPQMGFAALLFLFATVWATDIFAYLSGRGFGGPLLAPRLSPKKTWAGAVGGLIGGVVAGSIVAYASAGTHPVAAGVLALILSIAAQGGDLFESSVKRQFGAKDAGALIPGHGGVMDRVDGFLVAALVAVVIGALRFGAAASARGLLLW